MVTRQFSTRLCRGDIAQTVDFRAHTDPRLRDRPVHALYRPLSAFPEADMTDETEADLIGVETRASRKAPVEHVGGRKLKPATMMGHG